ncbi:MAG: hypothetical protein E4G95_01845 [Bacteroidia bacterium]|nr:MAG: hypothetical protein E4G95_01845 [Bacteroidia bacterium]
MEKLVLSTAYFPPVSYFSLIANHSETFFEIYENYIKQTYRNRCIIYSANGRLQLSVPVIRGSFHKVQVKDLKIDYSKQWQRMHLRALNAAYRSSAFYEYYIDDITDVINRHFDYLVDLNQELIQLVSGMIGIEPVLKRSLSFIPEYEGYTDRRYDLTPKRSQSEPGIRSEPYFQVFSARHGFLPDMSILDLLFNMGPESYLYLK